MIELRNPHSAAAAIEQRPREVARVVLAPSFKEGGADDAWSRVVALARKNGVTVQAGGSSTPPSGRGSSRDKRDKGELKPQDIGGRISTAHALVQPRASTPLETLFDGAKDRADGKGLWLALDSLQDPHNLGAIFRTAAFFGVQGIVLTEERSAPLSAAAYDVSSGGLEHVPFTLQTNLQRAFEKAKDAGLWILGTSEHAHDNLSSIARDRPWLLVLGNEEKGMRRLTEEACDMLCKIPPQGAVGSLNVSVAAGILMAALSGK